MQYKKIIYFGGQKSGKSKLAEKKTLELSISKPYYIATYNDSYNDNEMQIRIDRHRLQRENKFYTIEESFDLTKVIQEDNSYLVDCISMWILNNIEKEEKTLLTQLSKLSTIQANIVFVLNDVNSGIIPFEKESRRFVDLTGIVGQQIASFCDEVYEVKLGIGVQLK